jgi:ectoine hydroxylase-related dioxygenase (phytanoyl-CoA dioxygenase family)
MTDDLSLIVSDEQLEAFKRDGGIVLRGVFKDWVDTLRAGVEHNIAAPSPSAKKHQISDGAGVFFSDYCNWSRIPEYRAFIFNSPSGAIAARLTGSKAVRLFHEKACVKEPMSDVATPWHQDQPYYCVNGEQVCGLWVALDPILRETSLELIAGSHRWGRWFQPVRVGTNAPLNEKDGFDPMPDIDAHRENYEILSWDLEPGDAIAFHLLTIHGSQPNPSQVLRRRAFITFWVGDDARFTRRSGIIWPEFPELTLHEGDPLDSQEFPLVWVKQ